MYYYRIFPPEKPVFCHKTESFFSVRLFFRAPWLHNSPAGRGSSRPISQLPPRRVAAAAAAACRAPRAPGHTEGSVKTVSRPHVVKEVVLVHFNGEFGHFLAKQLENNSLGIRTSVVTVCDQNRGPWSSQGFDICTDRRRCPSSFPLNDVYIQSWGILYIKCNMVENLK